MASTRMLAAIGMVCRLTPVELASSAQAVVHSLGRHLAAGLQSGESLTLDGQDTTLHVRRFAVDQEQGQVSSLNFTTSRRLQVVTDCGTGPSIVLTKWAAGSDPIRGLRLAPVESSLSVSFFCQGAPWVPSGYGTVTVGLSAPELASLNFRFRCVTSPPDQPMLETGSDPVAEGENIVICEVPPGLPSVLIAVRAVLAAPGEPQQDGRSPNDFVQASFEVSRGAPPTVPPDVVEGDSLVWPVAVVICVLLTAPCLLYWYVRRLPTSNDVPGKKSIQVGNKDLTDEERDAQHEVDVFNRFQDELAEIRNAAVQELVEAEAEVNTGRGSEKHPSMSWVGVVVDSNAADPADDKPSPRASPRMQHHQDGSPRVHLPDDECAGVGLHVKPSASPSEAEEEDTPRTPGAPRRQARAAYATSELLQEPDSEWGNTFWPAQKPARGGRTLSGPARGPGGGAGAALEPAPEVEGGGGQRAADTPRTPDAPRGQRGADRYGRAERLALVCATVGDGEQGDNSRVGLLATKPEDFCYSVALGFGHDSVES
uniref:Uncharacterized protein n=1 Tax=Oxyrrhis marina TaxID=2969 RepID=A0A7S4LQ94_OXYMA